MSRSGEHISSFIANDNKIYKISQGFFSSFSRNRAPLRRQFRDAVYVAFHVASSRTDMIAFAFDGSKKSAATEPMILLNVMSNPIGILVIAHRG